MKQLIYMALALTCVLPLSGRCGVTQDGDLSASERFEALTDEVDAAYSTWMVALGEQAEEAEQKGEELPASAYTPPLKQFVPKFVAGAEDYAETDDAIPFLSWLVRQGMEVDRDAGKQAFVTLIDSHVNARSFRRLATLLPDLPTYFNEKETSSLLAKVEQNSSNATVRAWAVLARLSDTLANSKIGSEAYEAAKKELRAAMVGVDNRHLTSEVGRRIDVRERFSIGMVAPEIEGIDLDGQEFKLSDYKGKVVFLDFWGDW